MLHAIVVDGKWANWSNWSMCDVTCGNGTQVRTRTCTHPAPEHGGTYCTGPHSLNRQCVKEVCPGTYETYLHLILIFKNRLNNSFITLVLSLFILYFRYYFGP
jgi:hypothetical protein